MTKVDVLALPAAFDTFNGFYASYPNYTLTNPVRNALAVLIAALAAAATIVWWVRRLSKPRGAMAVRS